MSVFTNRIEGANTDSVNVSGTIAVSNPGLTDAELRATPVPVSGTVTANLGTVDGLALNATLTNGTQVTTVSGNVTVTQATGTNLHTVVDNFPASTLNKASTATITRVATGTAAVTVLAANASRKKFVIRTETGAHTYVAYGSAATSTNYTYDLNTDATLEEIVWTGSVSVARLSGTGNIQVTDLV